MLRGRFLPMHVNLLDIYLAILYGRIGGLARSLKYHYALHTLDYLSDGVYHQVSITSLSTVLLSTLRRIPLINRSIIILHTILCKPYMKSSSVKSYLLSFSSSYLAPRTQHRWIIARRVYPLNPVLT
jgi:hypothetical protein